MTPQHLMDMNLIQCAMCGKTEDDMGHDHHEDYICTDCQRASGWFDGSAA